MFQWQITLSDRQVIMLMAFNSAEPDKNGSQFHSVHAMISDAWDVRAARKLCENGLLVVTTHQIDGKTEHVWQITDKGNLIALAINEDSVSLGKLALRNSPRYAINKGADEIREKKKAGKK